MWWVPAIGLIVPWSTTWGIRRESTWRTSYITRCDMEKPSDLAEDGEEDESFGLRSVLPLWTKTVCNTRGE